jgi:hypothetical protein
MVLFGFNPGGGCIPDTSMQEIVRRLTGYVASDNDGGYIRSVGAPSDLTATWVPVDANGNRVGNNRVYSPESGQWVEDFGDTAPGVLFVSQVSQNRIFIAEDGGIYVAPKKATIVNYAVSNSGTHTIPFVQFGLDPTKIGVNINYTSDIGENPAFRHYIESLTDGELKLKVLGFNNTIVPVVNMRIEIQQLD